MNWLMHLACVFAVFIAACASHSCPALGRCGASVAATEGVDDSIVDTVGVSLLQESLHIAAGKALKTDKLHEQESRHAASIKLGMKTRKKRDDNDTNSTDTDNTTADNTTTDNTSDNTTAAAATEDTAAAEETVTTEDTEAAQAETTAETTDEVIWVAPPEPCDTVVATVDTVETATATATTATSTEVVYVTPWYIWAVIALLIFAIIILCCWNCTRRIVIKEVEVPVPEVVEKRYPVEVPVPHVVERMVPVPQMQERLVPVERRMVPVERMVPVPQMEERLVPVPQIQSVAVPMPQVQRSVSEVSRVSGETYVDTVIPQLRSSTLQQAPITTTQRPLSPPGSLRVPTSGSGFVPTAPAGALLSSSGSFPAQQVSFEAASASRRGTQM